MTESTGKHRRIRSYVLRAGRMTDAQQRALACYWPRYGVEFSKTHLDLNALFQRNAPKILDIGTGMGETTAALASAYRDNDFLAVEVHRPGIGSLLRRIAQRHLTNVRVCNHDVTDVLRYLLPPESLDQVYIFFPDPWPKKRHHKRRLINAVFLRLLKKCLKDGGRIFIATDWEDYAGHIMEVFSRDGDFLNLAGAGHYAPRPRWRPDTKFERRGSRLTHVIRDLAFAYRKTIVTSSP